MIKTALNIDEGSFEQRNKTSSFSDIRFILSQVPDGSLLICGDAKVRPRLVVPKPALHEAFVEARLQELRLAAN